MSEPTLEAEFTAFKDGVYDAIINGHYDLGNRRTNHVHYYKRGYDFGLTILSDSIEIFNDFKIGEDEE